MRTTLGEVCARMPFEEPPPDRTEVSFAPMASAEEETGRLEASQVRGLGSVRRGYTPFIENDVIFAEITPLRGEREDCAGDWPKERSGLPDGSMHGCHSSSSARALTRRRRSSASQKKANPDSKSNWGSAPFALAF